MIDLAAVLYVAGSGAATLGALQTASLSPATKAYQAASGFLAALAVVAGLNAYGLLAQSRAPELLLLSATMLGVLSPLLWLYVDDLSSDVARVWRWRDLTLLTPAILMGLVTALVASLPAGVRANMSAAGSESTLGALGGALDLAVFGVLLLILLQGGYLVWRISIRLLRLRGRLRQVMSNADSHLLIWLRLVTVLFVVNGLITLADNVGGFPVPEIAFAGFGLAFSLVMSVWAMRQAPAFQGDAGSLERLAVPAEDPPESASPKYERSRLDDERLEKIAARIETAFRTQRLHLDANLSLKTLAAATSVSEINLSQTFSRRFGQTFFDYVNGWRIEEAKALLTSSNDTILAVALEAGFNSRSAFYNAFNEVAGQTPAAFRAAQGASTVTPPSRRAG